MSTSLDRLKATLAERYRIEDRLGEGGMATVYLAEDVKHRRKVAIKVLKPELAAALGHERFTREIEIAAQLSHAHILPLFDSGEAGETLYYVMPFVQGESLRDRLEREGRLPVDDAIRLTDQIASALEHAHARGVIHRDIKPENILIADEQALVADFGIARAVEAAGGERLTGTGLALGTPAYMSPEQATGSGEVDAPADVYALGCVLYEMITGKTPFEGATPQALLAKHVAGAVPRLRTTDPNIPLFVERAVERALAKEADDRFASASEFARALTTGTVVARVRRRHAIRPLYVAAALVTVSVVTWGIAVTAGSRDLKALAVLPLTNLTGDTAQAFFVDGVHESLTSEIAQTGLTVISRRSVMGYRDSDKSLAEIARELGVDAVVEGGVFRDGDSVEIEARLIDADADASLWSGAYDGNLPDVVALYRGIAREIAAEIDFTLSPEAEARLNRVETVNADVYQAYLQGMYHINRATPQDIALGLQYLHEAVDRNPVDARAWAALAAGYITIGHSPAPTVEARLRASEAAERAVSLDPTLADGWAALAAVKTYYEHDWQGAEEAFQRANALNPNLSRNHYHYAWYLDLFDRLDEAIVEHERARDLDPFTPLNSAWLAPLYAKAGRVDEGIAIAEQSKGLQSVVPVGALALGNLYGIMGRWDEAIPELEEASAAVPPLIGLLAEAYARSGRTEEARAIVTDLESSPPTAMSALGLVRTYDALGDVERALDWLEFEPRHVWMPWIMKDVSDSMKARPRFRALVRAMDLEAVIPAPSSGARP